MLLGRPRKSLFSVRSEDVHYRHFPLPLGVKIDAQDRALAEQLLWSIGANGHVVNVLPDQRLELRLSRLIMVARHDQRVRHANGDLLDCRRENLIVERA
jgi:hypothetical protein